ncbi:T9SS type A sorting domain-containing protein [Flavobacterium caeni]|uniref:Por secretion system C-terminal sorting domain-containing protein n=1 Tax=Flavobacterium caeni TaxID=490189 RepID=A0A1G5BFU4_9FLAO|nr:T9SS type A sorting domain-containing protein [Flavobacterium caeni]SCX88996.1 Por secretion system C-terminal sorting domain-containing protein [Flavobacterium caeni]
MKKTTFDWKALLLVAMTAFPALQNQAQCLTATQGLYPGATYTPETCDGVTVNTITTLGYASEYSNVNVTLGQTYVFSSSIASDYVTISADDGVTAAAFGAGPLTWVSTIDGVVRFYIHTDDQCGESTAFRLRNVVCGTVSADAPDYANLQWPATLTVDALTAGTVYGQVYEGGLTDVEPGLSGQAAGIQAWVGINNENTDPSTWTFWEEAVHNAAHVSNNDEYMAEIGDDLIPGTYYYVYRYRLNDGGYVYGGIEPGGTFGGIWDGTNFISGILTVNGPANDDLAGAEAVSCDGFYSGNTQVASIDEDDAPDGGSVDLDAPNVWYSFTGTGTAQTVTLSLCDSTYDTSVIVYTGTSGALTYVAGNDDGCGTTTQSYLNFTSDGTTTYYITVEGYNAGSTGEFTMEVTCADVTPPAVENQTCATALEVAVDGSDTASDNSFGDAAATQPTCDLFGTIQDVWFSFEATSATADVLVTPGTMTSVNFNIYSGACGSLTAVAGTCNVNLTTAFTESLTGLTAQETYYVQVWSNAAEQGTFTLRVTDPNLAVDQFDASQFNYQPNPVRDVLNLSYKSAISTVSVFNLLGQQVLEKQVNATESQIDMAQLPGGTYLVKVNADNGTKTIKVIKQ